MRPDLRSRLRKAPDRLRRKFSPLAIRRAASAAGNALLWPYTVDTELRRLSGSTARPLTLSTTPRGTHRPVAAPDGDAARLVAALRAARRRLWVARSLFLAGRVLLIVAGAVFLLAVARLIGSQLLATVAFPIVAFAALGLVAIAFQRVTDLDAARVLDRNLGLRERLGTSVGLLGQPNSGAFAPRQLREAIDLVEADGARRAIAWRWPGRDLVRGGCVLALSATVLVVSAVSPPHATVDGAAPPNASPGAEEIQTGDWAEVVNDENGSLDLRTEDPATTARLAELKRQLETGEISAQQYADRVAALEDGLRQRAAESARQQESLARLADALKDSSATRDVANSLNRGDYASAAQQMADLANQSGQLSQQARQELADRLSNAAEQVGDRSPKLASAAKNAADSLRQGDGNSAPKSLRDLADQMAQAGRDVAPQSEMANALQQIQEAQTKADGSQGQLADSAQPGSGQGEGAGEQQTGEQSGQGSGPGDKPQASTGDGADKGGGAGSGPGSRTIGRGDGQDPAAPNQPVLRIDGKPTDAGSAKRQDTGGTPLTTTQSGVSSVKATDGFRQSSEPVNTVGEQNFVPFEMKPVVKDYFSGQPTQPGQ